MGDPGCHPPKGSSVGGLVDITVTLFTLSSQEPSFVTGQRRRHPGGQALGCHKQDCQSESHLFISHRLSASGLKKKKMTSIACYVLTLSLLLPSIPSDTTSTGRDQEGPRQGQPASTGSLECCPALLAGWEGLAMLQTSGDTGWINYPRPRHCAPSTRRRCGSRCSQDEIEPGKASRAEAINHHSLPGTARSLL